MTFLQPPLPPEAIAPIAPVTPAGATAPPPTQSAVVLELPQAVAALERPVLLGGTVIDQQTAPNGVVVTVQTALGDLLLQIATPLVVGRPVALQVPANPTGQTITLQVPANATGNAQQFSSATGATVLASAPGLAPLLSPLLRSNLLLNAILLPAATPLAPPQAAQGQSAPTVAATSANPAPPATTVAAGSNTTAPGAEAATPAAVPQQTVASQAPQTIAAQLTRLTLVQGGAAPTAPVAQADPRGAALSEVLLLAQAAAEPGAATTSQAQAAASFPQGTPIQVRTAQVLPPGSAPPALPPGGDLQIATVGSQRSNGFPVANLADGRQLVLQTEARVEPGTILVLQRVAPTAGRGDLPPAPLDPVRGLDWPALSQAIRGLEGIDPAAAQSIRAAIPQPNAANLAPALLFVAAALKLGEARALFGTSALEALKRTGKGAIAGRLVEDFADASAQTRSAAGEWRSYAIPLQEDASRIALAHLHVRSGLVQEREADGKQEEDEQARTRFVLDVTPSRLGPIQLDGLVRASVVNPLVDLVVRSERPLSEAIRRDIGRIWLETLQTTGAKGGLSFHVSRAAFVDTTEFRGLAQQIGMMA